MTNEKCNAIQQRSVPLPCARMLSIDEAAGYMSVSASTFLKMVDDGLMPRAKMIRTRKIWDVFALNKAIDQLPGGEMEKLNDWD